MKRVLRKLTAVVIALAAVITLVGTSVPVEAAAVKPTSITLKTTASTVDIKGKVTVSVKSVKPAKASKSVTYKSSNTKVATVSAKGVVTGKKAGKVTITVTSKVNKKVKKTVKITVKDLKAKSVTLSKTAAGVKPGEKTTLKATVKGAAGFYDQGVKWSSDNTAVATVSSKGVVTGVAEGSATITATEKGGSKTATCTVTVSDTNYISIDDLMKDIAGSKTYKVLDVRKASDSERGGYEQAHIIGSVSADVDGAVSGTDTAAAEANIKAAITGDAAATKYVLACYTGRSYAAAATKILVAAGVSKDNIYTLEGGMAAWNVKYSAYNAKSYTSTSGFDFKDGITVDQLKTDLSGKKVYTVLDLRDEVTYASGHIRVAVSTPLRENLSGADLTADTCKANLKKAVDANPNGYYVLVCYSGNKYANLAHGYLRDLGVAEGHIIVLEGGAAGWASAGNAVVKSTVPVTVDESTKTITLYGILNGTYLKEPTMHYLVTTGGKAADSALFEALCDRVEFAKALEKLEAVAWNTDAKTVLKDGEKINGTNGTNSTYTGVDVKVTWSGNETPLNMEKTLKTSDGSTLAVDEVFANSSAVANSFPSGCLICSTSCYAGVVANRGMAFGNAVTMGNAETLPAAGTLVKITVTLNSK